MKKNPEAEKLTFHESPPGAGPVLGGGGGKFRKTKDRPGRRAVHSPGSGAEGMSWCSCAQVTVGTEVSSSRLLVQHAIRR